MKLLLFISCLLFPFCLISQNSGRIIYEEEITFELPDEIKDKPEMQSFLSSMPKSRKTEKELIFIGDETMYKNIEKEEATNEGSGFMFSFQEPDNQYYLNVKTEDNIHLTEFFNKTFLISGEYEKKTWKMTKEQKMINEYLCFKAISGDSTEQVEVWFTPQIVTQAAPMYLNGLPGLILEVSKNEGKFKLSAKEIILEELEEAEIVKPSKGKKVTNEEFKKIVEKKTEEMKEQYGGKGSFIIMD